MLHANCIHSLEKYQRRVELNCTTKTSSKTKERLFGVLESCKSMGLLFTRDVAIINKSDPLHNVNLPNETIFFSAFDRLSRTLDSSISKRVLWNYKTAIRLQAVRFAFNGSLLNKIGFQSVKGLFKDLFSVSMLSFELSWTNAEVNFKATESFFR